MRPRAGLLAAVLAAAALPVAAPTSMAAPQGDPSAPAEVSLDMGLGDNGIARVPDISSDGSQATFAALVLNDGPIRSRVYVRDRNRNRTVLLAGAGSDGSNAAAPSISGDGKLVAWVSGSASGFASEIMVGNRDPDGDGTYDEAGAPAVRQVTDTDSDLPFQRTVYCESIQFGGFAPPPMVRLTPHQAVAHYGPAAESSCAPQLSADGSSLVFPALLDPDSPYLQLQLLSSDPSEGFSHPAGDLIDFGLSTRPGNTDSSIVELSASGDSSVQLDRVTIKGDEQHVFDLLTPPEGFQGCQKFTLHSEVSCGIRISFTPTAAACPAKSETFGYTEFHARLVTHGPTPRSDASYPIVADCRNRDITATPAARMDAPPMDAVTCTKPDLTGMTPVNVYKSDGVTYPFMTASGGTVEVGKPELLAIELSEDQAGGQVFTPPADCSMQLVAPTTEQQGERPEPCVSGEYSGDCTAYVYVRSRAVGPRAASLHARDEGGDTTVRVVVDGVRHVVVARRDPSGNGNFAGPGRPPAVVVSTDSHGNTINGTDPSISGTGRHVAFTSTTGPGETQVYVHDTDAHGDRGYVPGRTRRASYPPTGAEQSSPSSADSPALSADGTRVAYVAGQGVYVTDLPSPRTTTRLNDEVVFSPSTPVISGDGSTVAFHGTESEPDPHESAVFLAIPPAEEQQGAPPTYLVEGDIPSLDESGATIAFQTRQELDSRDQDRQPDVYAIGRRPAAEGPVALSPHRLDFGNEELGTTSAPRTVIIRNTDPAPFHVDTVSATGPYRVLEPSCAQQTLDRGQSCRVRVVFEPHETDTRTSSLIVTGTSPVVDGQPRTRSLSTTLTGVGVPRGPALTPAMLDFGTQAVGSTSPPQPATVTNFGPDAFTIGTVTASGPFQALEPTCAGTTLAHGQSCEMRVVFGPHAAGDATGMLTVHGSVDGREGPTVLTTTLAGTTPGAQQPRTTPGAQQPRTTRGHTKPALTPTTLDFDSQRVGTTSVTKTVTLTNPGPAPLTVTAIAASGPFRVVGPSCAGKTLNGRESCTMGVVFAPHTPGHAAGTLTVHGSLPGGTPVVLRATLTGSGVRLKLDRTIGPPGAAALATGVGFPPSTTVVLTWRPGLGITRARTGPSGGFAVSVPVLPNDRLGQRVLVATFAGTTMTGPRFLVVSPPGQPPGFHNRR